MTLHLAADTPSGLIFDVKRYAIHDGPGIRTTVFLKGCPLRCAWCQNPESWSEAIQISWREGRCTGCGRCIEACKREAIVRIPSGGEIVTDGSRCVACGLCVEACTATARELVGRAVSVDDVVREVLRDEPFYEESGGGVTFSGGEPLAQPAFLAASLEACRARGFHAAVDTTLYADWETIDALLPLVDLWLCDLKHLDSARHAEATGVANEPILDNLQRLIGAGAAVRIRIPVIPGFNDSEDDLSKCACFLHSLAGVRRVDLLPYNEVSRVKWCRLAKSAPGDAESSTAGPTEESLAVPASETIEAFADLFRSRGFEVTIGG